ncbi:hypothetical protein [Pseudomonas savastanoi]|uniref:hypothetical protein n=1 Tax=Pseudomonas savastanoi TaxID=29438 RepID=UPI001EDB3DE4|nr:hypothetical protein [Pseudomonas savastanoi]UKL09406.1 hypothetical protein HQ966_25145 [Pseudomonas savastanoi pv. savastanoi]
MKKVFLFPLLVGAALLVAGCEKTSEDHVQDAGKHEETFLQKQAQGDKQQAADEKAKAEKDYSEANQARSMTLPLKNVSLARCLNSRKDTT